MSIDYCVDCGADVNVDEKGVGWKMCFTSSAVPEPVGCVYRCKDCVRKLGPFDNDMNLFGKQCGIVGEEV